jgi:hypothetical protein
MSSARCSSTYARTRRNLTSSSRCGVSIGSRMSSVSACACASRAASSSDDVSTSYQCKTWATGDQLAGGRTTRRPCVPSNQPFFSGRFIFPAGSPHIGLIAAAVKDSAAPERIEYDGAFRAVRKADLQHRLACRHRLCRSDWRLAGGRRRARYHASFAQAGRITGLAH